MYDPGFNSGSLKGWQTTPAGGTASVVLNSIGDYELVIGAGAATTVGQRLGRLPAGTYVASVQVEVGKKAGSGAGPPWRSVPPTA